MVDCIVKGEIRLNCVYVDSMLGWLARMLRILFGLKVVYNPSAEDSGLAGTECFLVTRDEELFNRRKGPALLLKTDDHVKWIAAFIKLGVTPFEKSLCPLCGGELVEIDCNEAMRLVGHEIRSAKCWRCTVCGHVYWVGSHWRRLRALVEEANAITLECLRTY